jgi:Ca2+-binding EF-hand superfamily protein
VILELVREFLNTQGSKIEGNIMSTITNVGSYTTDMTSGISSGQRHVHGGHKIDPTQFANNLFKLLDTNNTGSIDKTQLEGAFSQSASNANATDTNSKADALFDSLDTNGDGQLTQAEVASALQQKMSAASDQFATRMGMQGKGHHHRPDGDADDAASTATSASNTATSANNNLQRQLMEMMRMMGISGAGAAQTATASTMLSATA